MKRLSIITLLISLNVFSQGKEATNYNDLTPIEGTEYVIASAFDFSKTASASKRTLLFINTKTGQTKKIAFEDDGYLGKVKQIKIDALHINQVIVTRQKLGKLSKGWNSPTQLMVFSPDGNEMTQLTDSAFWVKTFEVNASTGTIVIAGEYDANGNGKSDSADRGEIQVYDLKTLKLIHKI